MGSNYIVAHEVKHVLSWKVKILKVCVILCVGLPYIFVNVVCKICEQNIFQKQDKVSTKCWK
jgi:hypothetical protein